MARYEIPEDDAAVETDTITSTKNDHKQSVCNDIQPLLTTADLQSKDDTTAKTTPPKVWIVATITVAIFILAAVSKYMEEAMHDAYAAHAERMSRLMQRLPLTTAPATYSYAPSQSYYGTSRPSRAIDVNACGILCSYKRVATHLACIAAGLFIGYHLLMWILFNGPWIAKKLNLDYGIARAHEDYWLLKLEQVGWLLGSTIKLIWNVTTWIFQTLIQCAYACVVILYAKTTSWIHEQYTKHIETIFDAILYAYRKVVHSELYVITCQNIRKTGAVTRRLLYFAICLWYFWPLVLACQGELARTFGTAATSIDIEPEEPEYHFRNYYFSYYRGEEIKTWNHDDPAYRSRTREWSRGHDGFITSFQPASTVTVTTTTTESAAPETITESATFVDTTTKTTSQTVVELQSTTVVQTSHATITETDFSTITESAILMGVATVTETESTTLTQIKEPTSTRTEFVTNYEYTTRTLTETEFETLWARALGPIVSEVPAQAEPYESDVIDHSNSMTALPKAHATAKTIRDMVYKTLGFRRVSMEVGTQKYCHMCKTSHAWEVLEPSARFVHE